MDQRSYNNNERQDPVAIVAEKVTVAGLKESLEEHVIWIRNIFRVSLCLFSCYALFLSYDLIITWKNSGYRDELEDNMNQESLPFSNVTICAQVYFNKTFIKSNITVPKEVAQQYIRHTGLTLEDLYDQFSLFLAFTTQPRQFSVQLLTYFTKIYRANPQTRDMVAFMSAALPPCPVIFKKCRFDGIEFDCCDRAVQSIDENGVCYMFAVNFDSDNAMPSPLTVHQRRPGPLGGLTVEASMSVSDYPWFTDDSDSGFLVYVNPVPFSSVQSPLGAPHGAETFIKVVAAKRSLGTNCAKTGKLVMQGDAFMYYDPEGWSCFFRAIGILTHKYFSCIAPFALYRPNSTMACNPLASYLASSYLWKEDLWAEYDEYLSNFIGTSAHTVGKLLSTVEEGLKQFMSQKASCPKHCTYWTYQSSPSFVDLQRKDGSTGPRENMTSRIHVFYADLGYRQHHEEKEMSLYVGFYELGNVMGLYWGMSVISVFHMIYYIPHCLYVLRRRRIVVEDD